MTLKELNKINSDVSFKESRLQSQKEILIILTLGGIVLIALWQLFDKLLLGSSNANLILLRLITIGAFVLNMAIAFARKEKSVYKQHVTIGFYFGTFYCTLLAVFTGGSQSPYWYGLIFILIAWFVVLPYSYRELSIHGMAFIIIYLAGICLQTEYSVIIPNVVKISFLFSGILFLGLITALNRNKSDALYYRSKFEIKEAYEEVHASNEELRSEIEHHYETTRQLKEKQQFIDNILSNAPLVIWSIDLEGKFTYSQGKGLENLGLMPSQRIGLSSIELYKGTEVEKFLRGVLNESITEDVVKIGDRYYDTRISPLYNEFHDKIGYMGIALDITERIKTEKNLEKFRLVLDQAPGAVFIMDKNSNFEYINPFFTALSGYSEADLLHKNINDTLYHGKIPESRKEIINTISEGRIWQGELLTINKKGNEYWANTIAAPFKDEKGNVDGYIVIQQDVTEQKQMINSLKEREHLHQTLIEDSLEGVSITQDFKFSFVNKVFCEMVGYNLDELNSIGPTNIIAPEDRERVIEYHKLRMSGEKGSRSYTANFVRKDGSRFTAELTSSGVTINGKAASYISMRDITEKLRMEEALRESEKKYRELTEMLPQTVYELDVEGNITYFNQTGYKQFGIDGSDLGTSALRFISVEQHEQLRMNMQKTITEKQYTFGNKYTAIRKNGETFPAMTFAAPMLTDGKVVGIRGLILDMTDHEAMQTALRESERRYRELTELLPQTVYELDVEGNITYMNQTGLNSFGIKQSDLGVPAFNFIIPEEHGIMMYNMQKSLTENYYTPGNEYTAVRKNGERFPVMIFASPMYLDGKVTGTRGIILDMTEHKAMERALVESETKYRELVENTNSIILKWNRKYEITFLNEYGLRFFGYSREEILNKPLVGTIVPPSEVFTGRNLNKLMKDIFSNPDKYAHNTNENIRKNGERAWISWNNTAIADSKGQVIEMFSVGSDITERKMYEEELRITKEKLQKLNSNLEKQVNDAVLKLTEANTQLIRMQKENLQSQFEVLRQQVNPHFLFNSLNVLTSLIKLEPDLAEKFTEHLSKVYRYVLENKDNDLVDLKTELDFLDAYLFLLNIRFLDKIKVNVVIPESKKSLLILPLALQLLIENAIKHNSMSKKAPLRIEIFIDKKNRLNIVNNLQERESHMASTGVGLNNILHRYQLLEMPAPEFFKTENDFIARIPLKIND